MKRNPSPSSQPLPLRFESQDELERVIGQRVAERCLAESFRWRFRLVLIETILFAALIAAAGLSLGQPTALVLRTSILVGLSCFVSGMIILGLSACGTRLWSRLTRRRRA